MGRLRVNTEELTVYILKNIDDKDLVNKTSQQFNVSKQTVYRRIKSLVENSEIVPISDKKRYKSYKINSQSKNFSFDMKEQLEEDKIWQHHVREILPELPENVMDICNYGVTEMVNNVIDHSEATHLEILVIFNSLFVEFWVKDNGIGIFNKIQKHFKLANKNLAIFELFKGKLTSDPSKHSGEGIFFTSRMFDQFLIYSEDLTFAHLSFDWLIPDCIYKEGTTVYMRIERGSTRTMIEVFDQYTSGDDYAFAKTHVPVKLLQEGETLISRSQAKRLLLRFEKFSEIVLDFEGVKLIGQPFADEIFRVFQTGHPETHLIPVNYNDDIDKMIKHVKSNK